MKPCQSKPYNYFLRGNSHSNFFCSHRMLGAKVLTADGRNTVQGTFDDLSEEEKTRAYLQFLQYHQQLEQENETKRFQQMLNRKQNIYDEPTTLMPAATEDDTKDVDESLRVWYGLSGSSIQVAASERLVAASLMIFIMMVFQ